MTTLLVVDDEPLNRDVLQRRLERVGYHVLVADSGPSALGIVAAQHVDLVLLDVMMPGVDGVETLRRLRRSRSVSELPVIMVTAKDSTEDVVEALDAGANDYMTKPVDFAVAQARIRTQLTARRADPLTGLPNRLLFIERLNDQIARSRAASDCEFAVFFLDVDRFKIINDSLGHAAGDELLTAIARRLEQSLRSTDTIARFSGECTLARLGGDEFTVLVAGVGNVDDARTIAERLVAAVAKPFALDGREVVVTVSVGLVMADRRYDRAEEMVRDADTAMYRAKERGKARCEIFDTSMLAAAKERLRTESDLRRAIERQEFLLHYQPIVMLSNQQLCGLEALVRWQHPVRGLVAPDGFIAIAEETGLIVPIGLWVLREACGQMRAWDREFAECSTLVMNVNLSARQCLHPTLVADVARVLAETGLEPHRLKLEITESLVLEGSNEVITVLKALRELGVQLGLDDFGMGYSALSYLQQLPVQTLKIDRSFVNGIQNTSNSEIVRAILSLASGLSMNVTAEGVETADQAARLRDLSCEFAQGYFFDRPLTRDRARDVLQKHQRSMTLECAD
ncbi:MAG TPA: EAL domain-containing protein [Vicinamibacterales bacterium]|jgi:diguanylate cyclase (GGDEF)-like protein